MNRLMLTILKGLLPVLTALTLIACGSKPVQPPQDFGVIVDPAEPVTPVTPDKVTHHIGNPAVKSLWDQAETARLAGQYEQAIVHLERALQLEPQDAVMWSRLAEIRLEQGNANQAENLAAKSNAMTADNPVLNYRNWLIIARARRLQGDDIGAQEAEYTANTFIQ